ncbi:MAG: hypothetical protein PHN39_03885, partial [Candidatus Pacebacteria bacterium]|nr:hypothetical protein [Candidatus Paceibacterota bacterium]
MEKCRSYQKRGKAILGIVLMVFLSWNIAFVEAAWDGSAYQAGETLNPECSPSDTNCTVEIYWNVSGTNLYSPSTYQVGVGTTTPVSSLELWRLATSTLTITSASSTAGDSVLSFRTGVSPSENFKIYVDDSDSDKLVIATSTSGNLLTIMQNGYVGIGTTTPGSLFSIAGDLLVTGSTTFNGVAYSWPAADGSNGQVLSTDGAGSLSWATAAGGSGTNYWTLSGSNLYPTSTSYSIGIGTTTPPAKLSVSHGDLRFDPEIAPGAPTLATGTATGLSGNYHYRITFVTASGETQGGTVSAEIYVSNQKINLSNIPIGSSQVTARNIYRTTAYGSEDSMQLATTVNDNITTTYIDSVADGSLGAYAPAINTTGGRIYMNSTKALEVGPETTVLGYGAGAISTGFHNTFIGISAGESNTTGYENTYMGYLAGQLNTGYENTFIGEEAGASSTGNGNIFVGPVAGWMNLGSDNGGFGDSAGYENTGSDNYFFGDSAGWQNTGSGNYMLD